METYRSILSSAYRSRQTRNPAYSLRAFSRDLGLTPTRMSDILAGRQGLSPITARAVVTKLNLQGTFADRFIAMVEAEHGRSRKARDRAKAELEKLDKEYTQAGSFDPAEFEKISTWYNLAILELTRLPGLVHSPESFATKLGIPPRQAEDAITRLVEAGALLIKDGKYIATEFTYRVLPDPRSLVNRNYHAQILSKAFDSLEHDAPGERDFGAVTLNLSEGQIPKAKELLRSFRRAFLALAEESLAEKNQVYCFSAQLFPLTKKNAPNTENMH